MRPETVEDQLRGALVLARMVLDLKYGLGVCIAANGPTIGEVIERALTTKTSEPAAQEIGARDE